MRKIRTFLPLTVAAFLGFFVGASCDEIDAAFDCQQVCDRYQDCFDSSYDVDACRSRCRTRSEQDSSTRAAADACEACIDDMSCTSATFNCGDDCVNIVP
jgi:hypothetical protein